MINHPLFTIFFDSSVDLDGNSQLLPMFFIPSEATGILIPPST